MARANTQEPEFQTAPEAPQGPKLKRVIVQRPYGETASHLFVGFNDFERQIQYDVPVEIPEAVVNHLKAQRIVEYRPDETGKPVPTYANMFSVVDA